ncbi:hypothetical protein BDR03DRAFT_986662 [Suillus americanus]|nr:hypothetical protein BDR03DRAFT_986662 [Suillus americanus]
MAFGEVVHYVTQPTGWPEPVRDIASLLSPVHCSDRPSNEHPATAGLSALADLPHYGGERSTVPLWSQLLRALANTLSSDVLILTYSDRSRTSSPNEEDKDESMCSADSDSCDSLLDSLDLPLQAHMLPGRGRHLSAVLPVLLVTDSHNIVPLLCSTLYQRHVWGIRHPEVGLCCSRTGTVATAIFAWLDSDQSEEGRKSEINTYFSTLTLPEAYSAPRFSSRYIKGAISIEAVDSLTLFHWRSDLPDFETQHEGQLDERVASRTYQVHVQTSSSPSSQPPEVRSSTSSRAPSPYPNLQYEARFLADYCSMTIFVPRFAALSDTGLNDSVTISNWLFERHAFTVGRIPIFSEELENTTRINAMVKTYDQMTAFTWSDNIIAILLNAEVDSFVSSIRTELCNMNGGPNCARQCDDIAKLHGANEADRRHEWDALLLNFFQSVLGQRDVLLERQLNLARNLAADDSSFATRARVVADAYENLCSQQFKSLVPTTDISGSWEQAVVARHQAMQFSEDLARRHMKGNFVEVVTHHSSKDPCTGKCDAILVIPCSGVATAMFQRISGVNEQEKFLKFFMLIQGPKPEKSDASDAEKETILPKNKSCDEPSGKDLLLPVLLAEYQKRDESAISTAMNQMKTYLVSAVTFLSELDITDQPVFGLVVNGPLGAITMAWRTNSQIYVMERNVRHYDIRDPLQALQFVSILPRLARHGQGLRRLLEKQLANYRCEPT